ncbi:MAG: GCN5 family acetyltransferase [Herpetosiphonaceae bacterium]|nr:MAG: GCN5 family acetyltransferase [Herpetosiphonaceae bacterium]
MTLTDINLIVPASPAKPSSAEVVIRRARVQDVPQMAVLINSYAAQGLMLPKSATQLYNHIRDFVVAEQEGQIIGCAGLKITWENLAEIISLAVAPALQGRGIGRRLVEPLLEDARVLGIPTVFALTYQVTFFEKLGFRVVPKEMLSQKVWQDCVHCPKQHCCDEIAMIREV